jgi:L-amino acid N-acyltransferase YncA
MIRQCLPSDSRQIAEIYNFYVRETVATFEDHPVSGDDMAQRISEVTTLFPWLLWQQGSSILGYAYATRWKERAAYRFSTESTIYVSPGSTGLGIGRRLYEALIAELRSRNVHCGVTVKSGVWRHESGGFPADLSRVDSVDELHSGDDISELTEAA